MSQQNPVPEDGHIDSEFKQVLRALESPTFPQTTLLGALSFMLGQALGDRWSAAFKSQTYERWISRQSETVATIEDLMNLYQSRCNELPCVFDEDASFLTRLMGIRETGEKELRLNCQLATMIFLDLATCVRSSTAGTQEQLKLALAKCDACVSLEHAWVRIQDQHFNVLDVTEKRKPKTPLSFSLTDPTISLPLLTTARGDPLPESKEAESSELDPGIFLSRVQFAGVMFETFLREMLTQISYEKTKPCNLNLFRQWVKRAIEQDAQLGLSRSSNFWCIMGDTFDLPIFRFFQRPSAVESELSALCGNLFELLRPLLLPSLPDAFPDFSPSLRAAWGSLFPQKTAISVGPLSKLERLSCAQLCYYQSMALSQRNYNWRPRVRLTALLVRGLAHSPAVTLEQAEAGATEILELINVLNAKLNQAKTRVSGSLLAGLTELDRCRTLLQAVAAVRCDPRDLAIAQRCERFLSNLWRFAVHAPVNELKKHQTKPTDPSSSCSSSSSSSCSSSSCSSSSCSSSCSSSSAPASCSCSCSSSSCPSSSCSSSCSSSSSSSSSSSDPSDSSSSTCPPSLQLSPLVLPKGSFRKADFSVDQLEAEQQQGDAGFLNENAALLAHAFSACFLANAGTVAPLKSPKKRKAGEVAIVVREAVHPLVEFFREHSYLTGLLVQAGIIDVTEDMQEWMQDPNVVFVCATCTVVGPEGRCVRAGVCRKCADTCHRALSHRIICIGKKKNFVCDCGRAGCYETFCLRDCGTAAERFPFLNHNFDVPPTYCYHPPSASACLFDNSDSSAVNPVLEVKVQVSEGKEAVDMHKFSARDVIQCSQCEDWYHPRCTFDELSEIEAARNQPEAFVCNDCEGEEEEGDLQDDEN